MTDTLRELWRELRLGGVFGTFLGLVFGGYLGMLWAAGAHRVAAWTTEKIFGKEASR